MDQVKQVSKVISMLLAVTLIGIPILATAAPSYYPKNYDIIIEASRGEKGLYIYGNMSVDRWLPVFALFSKQYPWITNIKYLDISGAEIIPRHIAESETGTPSADFLLTLSPGGWGRLFDEKRLLRYPSPEIPYLPKWSVRQETVYALDMSQIAMVWNNRLLPADMVPKGMADLAEKVQKNPDLFRGRITSFGEQSLGIYIVWALSNHHGEKFWNWLDIIGPATRPANSAGDQVEKMVSGEYIMSWMFTTGALGGATVKKAGKLIGWKYMEDGTVAVVRGMGIPAKAANVNSAKLFLDFLLSQEGQVAMTKGNYTVYRQDVADKIPEPTLHLGSMIKTAGEKNLVICGSDAEYGNDVKFKAMQSRVHQAYFGKK